MTKELPTQIVIKILWHPVDSCLLNSYFWHCSESDIILDGTVVLVKHTICIFFPVKAKFRGTWYIYASYNFTCVSQ